MVNPGLADLSADHGAGSPRALLPAPPGDTHPPQPVPKRAEVSGWQVGLFPARMALHANGRGGAVCEEPWSVRVVTLGKGESWAGSQSIPRRNGALEHSPALCATAA